MTALFKPADGQALRDAARSFAQAHGVSEGDTAKLQHEVDSKISTLTEGLGLSPAEHRQLATIVLQHSKRAAEGKHTTATTDDWSRKSIADLKSRHVSLRRVGEVVQATNDWLRDQHPAIHAVLKQDGALGSHPFITRRLTDRALAHQQETERKQRAAKYVGVARGGMK